MLIWVEDIKTILSIYSLYSFTLVNMTEAQKTVNKMQAYGDVRLKFLFLYIFFYFALFTLGKANRLPINLAFSHTLYELTSSER